MFSVLVTMCDGFKFLFITNDRDQADCRMAEFHRDPKVTEARWWKSISS